jgi:hypothetical protein
VGATTHRIVGATTHRIVGATTHRIVGATTHRIVGATTHRIVVGPGKKLQSGVTMAYDLIDQDPREAQHRHTLTPSRERFLSLSYIYK